NGQSQESTSETNPGHVIHIPITAAEEITTEVNEIEFIAHGNHIQVIPTSHPNGQEPLRIDGVVPLPVQPSEHVSNAQLSQPPIPSNLVSEQDEPQETPPVDLKNDSMIALGLFSVSAGSLVAVVVVVFGEPRIRHAHSAVLAAFTLLCFISLISDSAILLLAIKLPNISYFAKTVRLKMLVSVVSLSLAYTLAVFIILAHS
ncbi:hypothetical protein MKW98_015051, partial [Papaver atlanticum]